MLTMKTTRRSPHACTKRGLHTVKRHELHDREQLITIPDNNDS